MKRFLRWARGVLGMGALWGAGGFLFGCLADLFTDIAFIGSLSIQGALVAGGTLGLMAMVVGASFAVVLSLGERNRSVGEISLPRAAAWGFMGGVLARLIYRFLISDGLRYYPAGSFVVDVMIFGAVCAILAAATVKVARGAPDDAALNGVSPDDDTGPEGVSYVSGSARSAGAIAGPNPLAEDSVHTTERARTAAELR